MSGWNPTTGTFELLDSKLRYWLRFRTDEIPGAYWREGDFFLFSPEELFARSGIEIVRRGSGFWELRATPDELWESITGQKSNPEKSAHYYKNPATGAAE